MTKELRITATITMPDDAFAQAAILAKIGPAKDAFAKALSAAAGAEIEVEAKIVRPVERKAKAAAVVAVAEHPARHAAE